MKNKDRVLALQKTENSIYFFACLKSSKNLFIILN